MAVTKWAVTADNRYVVQGLSTDTKPSAPSGSTFYEVNTGAKWICHKGQWMEDLSLIYALTQAMRESGR